MRLKRNRLKPYYHKQAIPRKDNEGNSYLEYGPATSFDAEMWTAGGKIQMELYGQRLPNIRNLRILGDYTEASEGKRIAYKITNGPTITVNDGICLNVSGIADPDYRVVAIYPYRFLTLEVEKL